MDEIVMPIVLAALMFGVGSSLQRDDFRQAARHPWLLIFGLVSQVLGLPLLAVGLAHVFELPLQPATGLLLLACCPGGAGSNLLTYLLRADSALSVSLTSTSNLIGIVTTPLVFGFAQGLLPQLGSVSPEEALQFQLPLWQTILTLLGMVVLPVLFGLLFGERFPEAARKVEPVFRKVSGIVLIGMCVALAVRNSEMVFSQIGVLFFPVFLLNVLSMVWGGTGAFLMGAANPQRKAVAIEVGFQNAALALTLAITVMGAPPLGMAPAVYGLVMFISVFSWHVIELLLRQRRAVYPE